MNFFENLKMALSSIAANKMRAILTMLGIIIGICSVITITMLGDTISKGVMNALSASGMNTIDCYVTIKDYDEDKSYFRTSDDFISLDQLNTLFDMYPGQYTLKQDMTLSDGTVLNPYNETIHFTSKGVFDGYFDYNKFQLISGRFPNFRDSREMKYAALVSDVFVKQYFRDSVEPVGQTITLNLEKGSAQEFTIVGVYHYQEFKHGRFEPGTKEMDKVTPIYVPYTVASKLKNEPEINFSYIELLWNPQYDNIVLEKQLRDYFDKEYETNKDFKVEVFNYAAEMKVFSIIIKVITFIITAIGAISLIVGGVGVMNIMLVSVTERTREIGIRKALGAKSRTIKNQFVTEAIIICLIGGLLGIMFGFINGWLIETIVHSVLNSHPEYKDILGNVSVSPSFPAIIVSLIFSTLTGVFFGLYPAGKAAKMNPIDALRYD